MATMQDLSERLLKQFKEVPNVDIGDCEDWIFEALSRHGVRDADPKFLPRDEEYLVIMRGQSIGAQQIALRTGHFYRYQDGDEVVDKMEVSEQWQRMANALSQEYRRERALRTGSSNYRAGKRLDRK